MLWLYVVTIMRDKRITLITVLEEERDSSGFKTGESTQKVEIFAEEKSVGRREYYEALRASMQVSIIFSVDAEDFQLSVSEIPLSEGKTKKVKASKIEYEGDVYRIVRSYKTDSGTIELTCSEVE